MSKELFKYLKDDSSICWLYDILMKWKAMLLLQWLMTNFVRIGFEVMSFMHSKPLQRYLLIYIRFME